ncbi:hypothetical protein PGT21_019681 [Puccinia graminis f. sp. tritici]|uniref:Uncharacterized protein n=1 Tax=Puccinia graminis f. sp. tritici TaxID=56615 RepID=A0A5B0M2Z6_PUCGR|nr:hypothetical protein PGT21_019681 [Puccinia graminis f. sp. tritici]
MGEKRALIKTRGKSAFTRGFIYSLVGSNIADRPNELETKVGQHVRNRQGRYSSFQWCSHSRRI